ncbi:MAG TPA: hemerythrin domain-containing protein [Terriglobales bacterium]|jgi:regulator of cell morphogenesis and NO signaling|nr:hemerythrin domain-containing protein [Terriglobales bacterium]
MAHRPAGVLIHEHHEAKKLLAELEALIGVAGASENNASSDHPSDKEKSMSMSATQEQAEAERQPREQTTDWQAAPLAGLIEHIINTHHQFTRQELARLDPLLDKVCKVHGQNHPELLEIRRVFAGLSQELTLHMMKEERILFPYIAQMEEAVSRRQAPPVSPFGTVENPIHMMMTEHDSAGEALRQFRSLSSDYAPPADACVSYRTLYNALAEFEQDLHRHIHLENNILFPRAIGME